MRLLTSTFSCWPNAGKAGLATIATCFVLVVAPLAAQSTEEGSTPARTQSKETTPSTPTNEDSGEGSGEGSGDGTINTTSGRTATAPTSTTDPAGRNAATPTPAAESDDDAPPFVLVIHAQNEIDELDRSRISKMFLKKIKRWPDKAKTPVEPVDQSESSSVRETFTRAVHSKDLFAIKSYWQRMIFSGRMAPPAELRSDEEVLDFVRNRPGAIGYVQRGTELGDGVKELKISRDEK